MLEAAYVLPLMVVMIILVVEALSFALTSFAVSDVLTDTHTTIIGEVSEVANADSYAGLTVKPKYANCNADGRVDVTDSNSVINDLINSYLPEGMVDGSATITKKPDISGFYVYVIEYKAVRESMIVLPDPVANYLPISVDTIITIKDSCNP